MGRQNGYGCSTDKVQGQDLDDARLQFAALLGKIGWLAVAGSLLDDEVS